MPTGGRPVFGGFSFADSPVPQEDALPVSAANTAPCSAKISRPRPDLTDIKIGVGDIARFRHCTPAPIKGLPSMPEFVTTPMWQRERRIQPSNAG